MFRRRLATALAFALLPAAASATDLLQTYEMARAGDPQFSVAEANQRVTQEGRSRAIAAMLPQLDASASISRSWTDGESTEFIRDPDNPENSIPIRGNSERDTETRRYGVEASQMVFDMSRFTTLKSQNALSRASDFNLAAASDNLITRTSAAYFNVLVQLETLAAAEAAEAALKKQFDFASKRLEVGLAPITDVHEARAQYDSARANTILVRTAVADAYQALAEITGQPVADLQGLPKDFQPQLPVSEGVDDWVQTAFENNPSLRSAELQLQSAEADISTARAQRLPTLYLGASYEDSKTTGDSTFFFNGTSDINVIDQTSDGPGVALTLSVPLFHGGAIRSDVRRAVALRDVASEELEQQKRALERNTRNAYRTLVAGISEVEARRLALVSAQAAYDASQVGLEVGTRTVLDVLNNQQNLFQAQQAYAQARYNYLQSRLQLEQAAGTLDIEDVQAINALLTADADAQVESDIQQ